MLAERSTYWCDIDLWPSFVIAGGKRLTVPWKSSAGGLATSCVTRMGMERPR